MDQKMWVKILRWAVARWLPSLLAVEQHVPILLALLHDHEALATRQSIDHQAAMTDLRTERDMVCSTHLDTINRLRRNQADALLQKYVAERQRAALQIQLEQHIQQEDAKKAAISKQDEITAIARQRALHALHEAVHRAFSTVGLNPDHYAPYYDLSFSGRLNEILYYTNAYLGNTHPLRTVEDVITFLEPIYTELLTESTA